MAQQFSMFVVLVLLQVYSLTVVTGLHKEIQAGETETDSTAVPEDDEAGVGTAAQGPGDGMGCYQTEMYHCPANRVELPPLPGDVETSFVVGSTAGPPGIVLHPAVRPGTRFSDTCVSENDLPPSYSECVLAEGDEVVESNPAKE